MKGNQKYYIHYFRSNSSFYTLISCGSDEAEFLRKWPAAVKGTKALLIAIHEVRQAAGVYKSRASKNGKPGERKK